MWQSMDAEAMERWWKAVTSNVYVYYVDDAARDKGQTYNARALVAAASCWCALSSSGTLAVSR